MSDSGMKTAGVYRVFYADALAKVRKAHADYNDEVRRWYADGEGAPARWVTDISCANCGAYFGQEGDVDDAALAEWCSDVPDGEHALAFRKVNVGGLGHTFPHCIHGASRWTDYDNICGGCEDSLTAYEEARGIARERWLRFCDRFDWFMSAPGDLRYQLPEEYTALSKWALGLFPGVEAK